MQHAHPLEPALGHAFSEPQFLLDALVHATLANEAPGTRANQRLAHLGDAVVELAVREQLFQIMERRGDISAAADKFVSDEALAQVARRLGLFQHLRQGNGGVPDNDTVLAEALEAVIAAVYLDAGYAAASAVVRRHIMDDAPLALDA